MKTTAKFPNWPPWLCFTLLMIALVALGYRKQANHPAGNDFDVYLQAARLMLEEAELYQVPTHGVHYYRYPPLLAFLTGPLARLSFESALLVWLTLNAIIVSVGIQLSGCGVQGAGRRIIRAARGNRPRYLAKSLGADLPVCRRNIHRGHPSGGGHWSQCRIRGSGQRIRSIAQCVLI